MEHLLRALTENSFLVCAYGGLIEPVTSGQEYEKGNIEDRMTGELGNQEEELASLNSKGIASTGFNVGRKKVSENKLNKKPDQQMELKKQ